MQIDLHPKQFRCFNSSATEILYGGAAGGGKSHVLRVIAIALCHSVPGIQVYLFRRLSDDLIKNHIDGPTGFLALLGDWIADGTVKWNASKHEFTWPSGAKIHLCHCQHEKDVFKYQGAEIHCLLIDEGTHFTEYIYRFLRNRVRLGALKVPEQWRDKLPRIVVGSNPGNIGHSFFKRTFVNFAAPFEIKRAERSEGGMLRQFIPARLNDNPTLTENDPDYEARLEGLGDPTLVRAMKDGDWDITAGAAFEKLSRDVHIIRPFDIPEHWTRFTSIDWGTAKPYSHGWFCINDEDLVLKAKDDYPERLIAKGSIIQYRELYGYNGKPNEGIRHESWQVAQIIAAIETGIEVNDFIRRIQSGENCAADIASCQRGLKRDRKDLERIDYRIGDSAMWAEHDGPSVAENMMNAFDECNLDCAGMEQSRKDRIANYQEMRNRISARDGDDKPGFYTFPNCEHFWRTVPDLQLDERHPEKGPDTEQEDHCLTPETEILTDKGPKKLAEITNIDRVLTTEGYMPCFHLGVTNPNAITYRVKLSDGHEFSGTGNHPVLRDNGTYVRLDSLRQGDNLCVLKSYPKINKSGTGKLIGYAANIFNAGGSDCTARFGRIATGQFQKAFISITRTATDTITNFKILSYCLVPNISATTCKNAYLRQRDLNAPGKTPLFKERKQNNGTKAQRGENGTVNILRKYMQKARAMIGSALCAKKLLSLINQTLNAVGQIAGPKNSAVTILDIYVESGKRPVMNLCVPGPENYCLANGLIVHNCYDMTSYAIVSRPKAYTRRERIDEAYDEAQRQSRQADRGGSLNVGRY